MLLNMNVVMKMKRFYLAVFLIVSSLSLFAGPKTDAVYHLISKAYTLNADGSVDYHFRKELQLFTTSSFDTYGETLIEYNPDFQTLTINEAYTVRKDGSIVQTPKNAFNPSLPYGCTDCERFNSIREMVVTHTALEYDATIVLDYTIHTSPLFFTELMERVDLYENEPIEQYVVSVTVPDYMSLNFYYNIENKGVSQQSVENGRQTTVWTYSNLAPKPHEDYLLQDAVLPFMLLTTLESPSAFMDKLLLQNAFMKMNTDVFLPVLQEICTDSMTQMQKALAIRDYVADNIHTNDVPMKLMNYIVASPYVVWKSNCGNAFEKDLLMFSMLSAAGLSGTVGVLYQDLMSDPKGLVRINIDGQDYYISSANKSRLSLESMLAPETFITITGEVTNFLTQNRVVSVDALVQVNRVSGKMIPDVTIRSQSVTSPLTKTLVDRELKVANVNAELINGYYYKMYIDDGDYGCDIRAGNLNRHRLTPAFVPVTKERYQYEVVLPDRAQWVGRDYHFEKSYAFGNVKVSYCKEGSKMVIVRELNITQPVISLKEYKAFREMMVEWSTDRSPVFLYEHQ